MAHALDLLCESFVFRVCENLQFAIESSKPGIYLYTDCNIVTPSLYPYQVPADVQPSELTSRDVPTEVTDVCAPRQMVDGCGFSKRRAVQQVYAPAPIARGGGSTTSPYLFEPIPGIYYASVRKVYGSVFVCVFVCVSV